MDEEYTPAGAWIACGLSLMTLPICVYPFVKACRRPVPTGAQATPRTVATLRALAQEWVWIAMTLSHCCLILYALLSAAELGCEDNRIYQDFDYGWETSRSNCSRNILLLACNLAECLIAPWYPISMLLLYLRLLPRSKRKRFGPMVKALALFQGFLSVALFVITLIDRAPVWTVDSALMEISNETGDIYHVVFHTWFAFMLACGCVSLIFSTRLVPHLQVKALASPSGTDRLVLPHAKTPAGERTQVSSPLAERPSSSVPSKPSAAAQQVQVYVRWLRACIGSVFLILAVNITTVATELEPQVLKVTLGWVSCHCISFALCMATSFVKRAVIARRMVPQSMAGTLAKSGWSGDDNAEP